MGSWKGLSDPAKKSVICISGVVPVFPPTKLFSATSKPTISPFSELLLYHIKYFFPVYPLRE